MRKIGLVTGVFALALTAGGSAAYANPILVLQSGGSTTTVTGGSNGIVTYQGPVGGYDISVTTGIATNTEFEVDMHLNTVDVVNSDGSPLTITLADTDFSLPALDGQLTHVFGTVGGIAPPNSSVTFTSWVNPANAALAPDGTIPPGSVEIALGGVTNTTGFPQGFSGNGDVSFLQNGMFSLFSQATINIASTTSQIISFDQHLFVPVPEPFTLALVGSGLAALAFRRRTALRQAA